METKNIEMHWDSDKAWFNIGLAIDENGNPKVEFIDNALPKNYPYINFGKVGKDAEYDNRLKKREALQHLTAKLKSTLAKVCEEFESAYSQNV